MKRYEGLFLALVFFFAVILDSIFSTAKAVNGIENAVVRLHVLAHSDEEEDQTLKLLVRDKLLKEGEALFLGVSSKEEARKAILQNLPKLRLAAQTVVLEQGYSYPVAVTLSDYSFETREYEDFSLPKGEYLSLRVVIGAGEGRNWWCILYPPLCLSAAGKEALFALLSPEEQNITEHTEQYEVRLWIVEKLRQLFNK